MRYNMLLLENFSYHILGIIVLLILLKVLVYVTVGISKSNASLVGKTVLITGGNSGIGYETALALAARGGRIIIADKDDATESINKIIAETNNKNIVYKHLNLSSLASVRNFAKEINEEEDRLDILINNAGIAIWNTFSEDGLQTVMQTNHFGPFLLTHLLIDLLKKSAPSRVIFVSSILAFINNVSVRNLNKMPFRGLGVYSNSKMMNIITANIFAQKLHGTGVTSNSLYPGTASTPIFQKIGGVKSDSLWKIIIYKILLPLYGKTPWEAAQTPIECALSRELETVSGKYFVECKPFIQPRKASNVDMCMKLWEKSEELVHLSEAEKL